MPKVKRGRTSARSSAAAGGWQSVGRAAPQMRDEDEDLAVSDSDLQGLDVSASAGESEASKRAAVSAALQDLLAMGSDDEGDDEDSEDGMGDEARIPAKGSLFKKTKAGADAAAPAPALTFAPSLPTASSAAPAAAEETAAQRKLSKVDKRSARHARLMSRLGMPGSGLTRERKKNAAGGLSMQALKRELAPLLTPTEQRARALQAQREALLSDRRDVLFLSDGADQEKLRKLHATIEEQKAMQRAAAKKAAQKQKQQSAQSQESFAETGMPAPSSGPHASYTAAATPVAPVPAPQKSLSAAQRRRLARNELAQFSAVLQHPSFQASPLQALQTHLQNSAQLQKLQAEAEALDMQAAGLAPPQQQARKNISGSKKKKKNRAAEAHRQQVLQQMKM